MISPTPVGNVEGNMRAKLLSNMRLVVPAVALFFSAQILADIEQARLDAVAANLQARIDDGKLSGAVVMVAQDGEVLMQKPWATKMSKIRSP